jgi:hypothetical protein
MHAADLTDVTLCFGRDIVVKDEWNGRYVDVPGEVVGCDK